MTKQEFENLTIRNNGTINQYLYDTIERFYMSTNDYHRQSNTHGTDEDKQSFCKRVFGGKINTPKTILTKIIAESVKENNYALSGNKTADKAMLDHHATLIAEQYTTISKW